MEASKFIELAEPDKSTTLNRYAHDIEPDKAEHNTADTE